MPANTRTLYQADDEEVYPIRMKPETFAVAGTPPAGPATQKLKVQISKSTRSYGLKPRGVTLARTIGTAPETFTKSRFLPVLTPAAFETAAFADGATITIGAIAWTVVGRRSEDYN